MGLCEGLPNFEQGYCSICTAQDIDVDILTKHTVHILLEIKCLDVNVDVDILTRHTVDTLLYIKTLYADTVLYAQN